ncbi:MAG: radical SAM protein, partial [Acidobacteriota bacterium]
QNGIDVDIVNLNNAILKACRATDNEESFDFSGVVLDELKRVLKAFQPDLVGVTCMFSQTHQSMVNTCNLIKELTPDIPLALGGVHVTNSTTDEQTCQIFFKDLPMVDFFFMYESDLTLVNFVQVVNKLAPPSELAQILFNGEKETLYFNNRKTPTAEDLDILPAHDLITPPDLAENGKIGSYHMFTEPGTRFSTVLANRGCRAQCTFCSVRNFNGLGVRSRSVQSVIDELLVLRHDFGVGHIMWLDDDFLKDHTRAISLFNEMVRQDVGITWDCTNGVIAWSCKEEIIAAAAASGCVGLTIGMESGNKKILHEIKKPGTVEVFQRAASVFRQFEQINARVFLMIGFPHETFSMAWDTYQVAREMNLDWSFIFPLQPLPNTPIFSQMALEGMVSAVVFDEIRYKLGAHGKQRKSTEKKVNIFATEFNQVFDNADMDAVPTPKEIDLIWAYMNYHLNFSRLFQEKRHAKYLQNYQYLQFIVDTVAPDDAFAHYFRAYLYSKLHGRIEPSMVKGLESILEEAPGWQDRFTEFGLSLEHLTTGAFPDGDDASREFDRRRSA